MVSHVTSNRHQLTRADKIAGSRRISRKSQPTMPGLLSSPKTQKNIIGDLVKTINRLTHISNPDEQDILRNMIQQVDPELIDANNSPSYPKIHQQHRFAGPKRVNRASRNQHSQIKSRHTQLDRSHFKRNLVKS